MKKVKSPFDVGSKRSAETIIWAIDPFEKETRPDQSLVHELMNWVKSSNLELQPVYLLSLSQNNPDESFQVARSSSYIKAAEKAAESYLKDFEIDGILPAQVILTESFSIKEKVKKLLELAEEKQSLYIVVSSHGRSGLQRLILGSFAENLLLHSRLPILFMTHSKPAKEQEKSIKRVLFATDFSDFSREAFILFLAQAKRLDLALILFHSVSLPAAALASGYGAAVVIPNEYFPNQIKWATEEGARWVKLAEAQGVHLRFLVRNEGVAPSTSESILSIAHQEHAGLIAMVSVSGAVASLVMGSVARDVFRSNRYPVWIYGPKSLEKEK